MPTIKERYDANQIITTVEGTDLIPAQKISDVAGKVLTIQQLKDYIAEAIDDDNTYSCDSSVTVGKLVYLSNDGSLQLANNTDLVNKQVYGVVKLKASSTTAKIKRFGELSGYSGISVGSLYYLSIDGNITVTCPTTSGTYINAVGIGKNSSTVFFRINNLLILN